jgi:hypothetical protein
MISAAAHTEELTEWGRFLPFYMEYAEKWHDNWLRIPNSYLKLLYDHISEPSNTIKLQKDAKLLS